ncbi:unnamed protein product [Caenorhabditis nigoni]
MCPCVLIDKLRNAFGKKKRNSKETSQSSNSATSPVEPGEDKRKDKSKKSKKSRKSEKSEKSRGKSKGKSKKAKSNIKSPDTPGSSSDQNTLSGRCSRPDQKITDELRGQVIHNKPDPKNFLLRVLQTERPDLIGPDSKLDPGELKTLDTHLLQKGELRDGIGIHLGDTCKTNDSLMLGLNGEVIIKHLYAYGRFGSVYIIQRKDEDSKNDKVLLESMILKTSRRMYASARMEHEIKVLKYLQDREKNRPTHIVPIISHGTAGGTPYFLMPALDANLEKIRQEIGHKMPWVDAFYIGQEALIGIKECHELSIIHRDVKPTNLLLAMGNIKAWVLSDLGDSCPIGESKILSPPDALTIPYISRYGHVATQKPMKATIAMDIESWFYLFLDLFMVLPWKNKVEEDETLAAKNAFWENLNKFFEKNSSKLPPQILPIAQIVSDSSIEKPYSQLTAILRDGFTKNNKTSPWKPDWIEKRPKKEEAPTRPKTPGKGEKTKSGMASSSAGTSQTTESVSKNQKTSGKKSESKSVTKSATKSVTKKVN